MLSGIFSYRFHKGKQCGSLLHNAVFLLHFVDASIVLRVSKIKHLCSAAFDLTAVSHLHSKFISVLRLEIMSHSYHPVLHFSDPDIKKQLQRVEERLSQDYQKEKALYKGMFSKQKQGEEQLAEEKTQELV